MTAPHSTAFAAALASVSAILGDPASTERVPLPMADTHVDVALWRRGDESIALRVYADGHDAVLVAESPGDVGRSWSLGDDPVGAARAAREHLGWPQPRPTLPGLAPRPVDRDGAPRSTTGGPMGEGDW